MIHISILLDEVELRAQCYGVVLVWVETNFLVGPHINYVIYLM